MSWIKTILLNSIVVIASFFFGVLLIEIFLIYEDKRKPVENIVIDINYHKYPFLKSNSTLSPLKIKQNQRKLLILGDSFVEGNACAVDDANFPSHLSQKLKGKINVVNLGIGGLNNADYVDFLDHFAISRGDVALVTLYDNDIHISQRNCEQIRRQAVKYDIYVPSLCTKILEFNDKSKNRFLQKVNNKIISYKTAILLKEALFQIPLLRKHFYRHEYRKLWNDFESEENKWIRSSLRVMKKQMISQGANALFTYYPNTNRISDNDERHKIWTRFIEFVKLNDGIEISDPYPYFIKNASEKSMVFSLTDRHPNCKAHSLMSEFTYSNLKMLIEVFD